MSKTYHFIGIKGSGMSALALMLHQMGHKVQGSDVEKYYFTQRGLEQAGIPILPFDEKNITEDVELIAGNAFREDNNVKLLMQLKMATALSVTTSSWVTSWINSLALVWQVHMVRLLQQVSCHML